MKNEIKIGQKYGRLTIVKRAPNSATNQKRWECVCECGKKATCFDSGLKRNRSRSCGCLQKESVSKTAKTHGHSRTGKYKNLYKVWASMKNRCYNKNDIQFRLYGGRGIKMCDRWLKSFEDFISDVGERPSEKYSLDRINNDGNYEPSNIRWATATEQSQNTRRNVWIEYNGRRMILADWARLFKISESNFNKMRKIKPFSEIYNFYQLKGVV